MLGRLLPADRARPAADLLCRRHRQPRARRVLRGSAPTCAVELTEVLRLRPGGGARRSAVALLGILFERSILRRFYTADPILSLLATFGLAMVTEQAIRIIWARRRCRAAIPQKLPRLGDRRRLPVLALPPADPCRRRRACCSASGCCCTRPRSAMWCAPCIQRPDMVAALGIRLQPYMTADRDARRRHGGAWRRALRADHHRASRRWAPRSSRWPSSWS